MGPSSAAIASEQSQNQEMAPDVQHQEQPPRLDLTVRLTTPVEVHLKHGAVVTGSGFFFVVYGPDPNPVPTLHWRRVDKVYLITAKHVIDPDHFKRIETFDFGLRSLGGAPTEWNIVRVEAASLKKRLHISQRDPAADVAAIDVTDLMHQQDSKGAIAAGVAFDGAWSVSKDDFPGASPLKVYPGDDVIVIGYPRGIYDAYNKLPILKSGLLSTLIGLKYGGRNTFLVDFQGYEGSSGSIVISKPTAFFADESGHTYTIDYKHFLFLGVYTSNVETNERKPANLGLGIAWYYTAVEDAVDSPPFDDAGGPGISRMTDNKKRR